LALKQFYIKNVGLAKIQRVQQKIPVCCTYVRQNENKFQKVCNIRHLEWRVGLLDTILKGNQTQFGKGPHKDHPSQI
jgi:hypothetical protein